jgi:hypothetical protein
MPEIEIRPAALIDMNTLLQMDHSYQTDYVWQMDRFIEKGVINIHFRETRLPRPVRVDYPNPSEKLVNDFSTKGNVMAAVLGNNAVGYIQHGGHRRTAPQGDRVGAAICSPKLGGAAQSSPHGIGNAIEKFPGDPTGK